MAAAKNPARGNACGASKLNEELVRRIRAEHAAKEEIKRVLDREFGTDALAARYKVNRNTITKVLTRATWFHVL